MRGLQVAPGLSLPVDYMTKTCAILAQRRKGKSYTGAVVAEELVEAKLPFVALDPTGAWWGLRAAADGRAEGYPVVILGGQHGDLPLERHAGRFIADLVTDEPGYYVLDLSLLGSRAAEKEFAARFAERLHRRKMQPGMGFPLHLFVDEADMFVPQERERDDNAMLGAFQGIVRRGGLHGLGTTLISQRPALVNKNALTQLDVLVLLRLVAGNDQDYVDKQYISRHASPEQRRELMGAWASLALGEAFIWEPGAEPPLFCRVHIRERRTFNSSATPKVGERAVEPRRLAAVDLAAIKERMAETIERAKADDPAELRRRIAALERELAARPAETVTETVTERVEVPVLDEALVIRLEKALDPATGLMAQVQERLAWQVHQEGEILEYERTLAKPPPVLIERPRLLREPVEVVDVEPPVSEGDLGGAPGRVLTALAQHPQGRTRRQAALQAGISSRKSTFRNALSALRTRGWIESSGELLVATDAGLTALGSRPPPLPPPGPALAGYWLNRMGGAEQALLQALVDAWPDGLSRAGLAAEAGVDPEKSTLRNALSRLRGLGLLDEAGRVITLAREVMEP